MKFTIGQRLDISGNPYQMYLEYERDGEPRQAFVHFEINSTDTPETVFLILGGAVAAMKAGYKRDMKGSST